MYEHNALGFWSGLALCLTKVRSSRARCPAIALIEISCTQDFQILFSKGHNSEKGHNLGMKKIRVNYFFIRNLYMKFQNPSIHRLNVSNFTEKW